MSGKRYFVLLFLLWANTSAVLALDIMGPPSAGVKKGKLSLGVDYSHSRTGVKLNQGSGSWKGFNNGVLSLSDSGRISSQSIKNLKLNKVFANIAYGVTDDWDVFLLLGGANADFNYKDGPQRLFGITPPILSSSMLFPTGQKADGDNSFAIGFGTKVTFCKHEKLKWGGLFQLSHFSDSDGKRSGTYDSGQGIMTVTGSSQWSHYVDIEITEIQIAFGPSYELTENILIYGGPFFHIVDGRVDGKYSESGQLGVTAVDYLTEYSYDIDERSIFGGYIGLQVKNAGNISFNIEYQHTAFADGLGINLLWAF